MNWKLQFSLKVLPLLNTQIYNEICQEFDSYATEEYDEIHGVWKIEIHEKELEYGSNNVSDGESDNVSDYGSEDDFKREYVWF
jgi:hypothetical protein